MHIYIIYCITNKINDKFYIGVHMTKDVNDNYMGSGKLIKRAIEKYGVDNFEKKILHIFTNKRDAYKKEKELVTESLVNNKACYNIKEGGAGGFDHVRAFCETNNHPTFKYIKIYHPITLADKRIPKDKLPEFLDNGWLKGFSPLHKQRLSQGAKAKIQTTEHRSKNSLRKKTGIIFVKENKHKWVLPDEVDNLIQVGWVRLKRNCLVCNTLFEVCSMPNTLCSAECKKQRLKFMAKNKRALP
jgi:hypothetical protein